MQRLALFLTSATVLGAIGFFSFARAQTVPTVQTVLVTPPLQLGTPTSESRLSAQCSATNVTFQPRRIQLQMYDGQGVLTAPGPTKTPKPGQTPGPTQTPVPGFHSAVLGDPGYNAPGSSAAGLRYCVVIVNGEADDVRASLCLTQAFAGGSCVTSAEAR